MSEVRVDQTGATVVGWSRSGQHEALWVSPLEQFAGGPIRGGVPVCFPWFGRSRMPAHGLVRAARWTELGSGRWEISSNDVGDAASWNVTLQASGGEQLSVTMTVTNTGAEPFTFEQALHAYLRVSDVRDVEVTGLEGAPYFDKITESFASQDGSLRLSGPTDRVYSASGEVLVRDPSWGRILRVRRQASANAVVWNPWQEAGMAMADVGEHWAEFICVEAANIGQAAVELETGQSHTMGYSLEVLPL